MPRVLASLIFLVMSLGPAWARSQKTLSYPRDSVWPTAVRFLVVDEHAKILEKDADTGYVVFEIVDGKKTYRGTLEVMTVNVDGHTEVRFVLQIPDRPSYMEDTMLQRLERKIRAEHGSPTPPPSKSRDKDGADKDGGKDKDGAKDKDTAKDKDSPKDAKDKPRDEGGVHISPTP